MATIKHEYRNGLPVWTIYIGGVSTLCEQFQTQAILDCLELGLDFVLEV